MLKKTALLAGVCLLMAGQLKAQGLAIGPQIGYQKAGDADNGKLMFGGALRLKLSSMLAVEGSINYRQEDFSNQVTVKSWPVMVTGMLYVMPIVYGAVGAGWYNTTFDFNTSGLDNKTEQQFGWHFGGGVELPLGSSTKLTGDIRYAFLDYDFGSVPFADVDSNFYVMSAGIMFGL